jgi:hypothetical protein
LHRAVGAIGAGAALIFVRREELIQKGEVDHV